jgi:hypothetical protein
MTGTGVSGRREDNEAEFMQVLAKSHTLASTGRSQPKRAMLASVTAPCFAVGQATVIRTLLRWHKDTFAPRR